MDRKYRLTGWLLSLVLALGPLLSACSMTDTHTTSSTPTYERNSGGHGY